MSASKTAGNYGKQQKFYLERHHTNSHTMIYLGTHSKNYYVRYDTVDGYITKSLRTTDLDKAKTKAVELAATVLTRNAEGISQRQTIQSLTDWFTKLPRYTELSVRRQKQIIRMMRVPHHFFKGKDISTIRPNDWKDYYEFRHHFYDETDHAGKTRSGDKRYSTGTLRLERNTFLMVMGEAVNHRIINQMLRMPEPPTNWTDTKKNAARPDATYTPAQYAKFRIALNKYVEDRESSWRAGEQGRFTAHMIRAILWTIRHSGVRSKECVNLTHSCLEERRIKLEDGSVQETFAIYVKPTKVKSPHARYAILNYSGYRHLKQYIEYKKSLGLGCEPGDWLFPIWRAQHRPYDHNLLGDIFRKIAQSVDLYHIGDRTNPTRATVRMLRRYYIIRQMDNGTPVEKVAMAVGHKPETSQRFYQSVMKERYETEVFGGSWHPSLKDEEE
jgi:hypothetical protein